MDSTGSDGVDHKMEGQIENNSTEVGTYSSLYLTDISDISHIIVNDNQTYIILSDATPTVDNYKCPLCEYSTSDMLDFKKHLQNNMGQKQCKPEVPTSNTIVTETPSDNVGIISGRVQYVPEVTNSNNSITEAPVINIGITSDQSQCIPDPEETISNTMKTEKSLDNIGIIQEQTNSNQVSTEAPMDKYKCPLCEYSTFNKVNFKKHLVNNIGQNRTQCIPEVIKSNDLIYSNDNMKMMKPIYGQLDQGNPMKPEQHNMSEDNDGNVKVKLEEAIESESISSQYHTNTNHRIISSESNAEPVKHFKFSNIEQKKYKCTHCKKCFDQKVYLSQHLKTHGSDNTGNPYKCTTCDKSFYSEQYLTRHERSHTKEKSYQCS